MSHEVAVHQCRRGCKAVFLSKRARNGHEHIHAVEGEQEIISGP